MSNAMRAAVTRTRIEVLPSCFNCAPRGAGPEREVVRTVVKPKKVPAVVRQRGLRFGALVQLYA